MEKGNEVLGLRKLRSGRGRHPSYPCDNCKCKRYSPCTCKRKGKNEEI